MRVGARSCLTQSREHELLARKLANASRRGRDARTTGGINRKWSRIPPPSQGAPTSGITGSAVAEKVASRPARHRSSDEVRVSAPQPIGGVDFSPAIQ